MQQPCFLIDQVFLRTPRLEKIARTIVNGYKCPTPAHFDQCIRQCRDLHYHSLPVDELQDLKRCIYRDVTPGFEAIAVAYYSLKQHLNDNRNQPRLRTHIDRFEQVFGRGEDDPEDPDDPADPEDTEDPEDPEDTEDPDDTDDGPHMRGLRPGERWLPRRRPDTWVRDILYDGGGSSVMSGLAPMSEQCV